MAESIVISGTTKQQQYESLLPQLQALVQGENSIVANAANIAAALKTAFDFFWVGFYFVENDQLVLGPFQGPVACTRIGFGKGVCGAAWQQKKSLVVPDVEQFPGHIACNSASRSEVVVPVFDQKGEVKLVLDVDSDKLNDFSELDVTYLEKVCELLMN